MNGKINPSYKHGYARKGKKRCSAYWCWAGIHDRCLHHVRYAGRGIKVCERWKDFTNFLADMGEPPPDTSIDRINNDGDYTPENCRWATRTQQSRNRRSCRLFTITGETLCLKEWCERFDANYSRTLARVGMGWEIERALKQPNRPPAKVKPPKPPKPPTVAERARAAGIPPGTAHARLKQLGWSEARTFSRPVDTTFKAKPLTVKGITYTSMKRAGLELGIPHRTLATWRENGTLRKFVVERLDGKRKPKGHLTSP